MQEYSAVSVSSYDSAALVGKLNEKAAEGWSVVSILQTGGDVTAFLSREAGSAPAAAPAAVPAAATPAAVTPAAEPSGWAVAPEPAAQPQPQPSAQPQPQPATTYQPAAQAAQPAAVPQQAVPANWYADPSGRFELRYWDGTQWTEHVSRAGQQFTDPPVA